MKPDFFLVVFCIKSAFMKFCFNVMSAAVLDTNGYTQYVISERRTCFWALGENEVRMLTASSEGRAAGEARDNQD